MSLQHNKEIQTTTIHINRQEQQEQQQQQDKLGFDLSAILEPDQEQVREKTDEQKPKAVVEQSEKKAEEELKSLPPSLEFLSLTTAIRNGKPVSLAERERLNREQAAWKTVRDFNMTIRLNTAADENDDDLADKTLSDMTAELVTDKGSKSEIFTDMQNALSSLSMMAASDGVYKDKDGNQLNADFYSVLYRAREATDRYVDTHTKRRRYSTAGTKRLAMAKRIQSLLVLLDRDVAKARVEANVRQQKEQSGEAAVVLTNDELRQIENDRGRQAANLVAKSSFIESHQELTLGLGRMKGDLREHIMAKLTAAPETMTLPVEEFLRHVTAAGDEFGQAQAERIERAKKRREKLLQRLDLSGLDDVMLDSDSVADLLLEAEDQKFTDEVADLVAQTADNDALILNIVERRISDKYSAEVFNGVRDMLGSARVFAGALNLAILVNEYIDRLKYTNAAAFEKVSVDGWNVVEKKKNKDDATGLLEDFSFISRMKGELLLKSPAMQGAYTESERAILARNMDTVLMRALNVNDLEPYNAKTFREYRMAARYISDRLVKLAPKYRELVDGGSEPMEVINGVLLHLADRETTEESFDALVEKEKQRVEDVQQHVRNRYLINIAMGALPDDEMKAVSAGDIKEAGKAFHLYIARLDQLKQVEGGRFALMAEQLAGTAEVFDLMMQEDGSAFFDYLGKGLIEKYGELADGLDQAKDVGPAAKQMYVRTHFKKITKGMLAGDAAFFRDRVREYNDILYKEKYDGEHTIDGNIDAAVASVKKKLKKLYPQRDAAFRDGALLVVFSRLEGLSADADQLAILKRPAELEALLLAGIADYDKEYDKPVQPAMQVQAPVPDASFDTLSAEVLQEKEKGKGRRDQFLRLNNKKINEMRQSKSMVMADHRSGDLMRITQSQIDERRGRVDRICGYLELPETLKSILIERISSGGGLSEVLSDETLLKAARKMDELYKLLPKLTEGDNPMGTDEVMMLITNLFANPNTAAIFYQPDLDLTPQQVLERKEVKVFRENYRKLAAFEAIEVKDSSLAQEQRDMSRNLRAVLITGAGLYDEKGMPVLGERKEKADYAKLFGDTAARHINYITYQDKFLTVLSNCLNEHENYKNRSALYKERSVYGFREYFQKRIMDDLAAKKEFSEEDYHAAIMEILNDGTKTKLVTDEPLSVSSETQPWLYDKAFDAPYTQEDMDKLLDENTWPLLKGCVNRYRALDPDQKKLFAIYLSIMDVGAIGVETGGTNALLQSKTLKEKQEAKLFDQINAYVAGDELHVTVDYKEALNKLTFHGINRFKMEWTTLSEDVFDKAHEFAVQVKQKRVEMGDRDYERMSDGISSIRAAATMGVTRQFNEAEKLIGLPFTVDDVFNRLLLYAKLDHNKMAEDALSHIAPGQRARYARMLVRVLQDRTLFDTTTDPYSQEKVDSSARDALFDALSGDQTSREAVMEGFDDAGSCVQALLTALSFQLKDDVNYSNQKIQKEHFAKDVLDRETLIDWKLVSRAMGFIREVTQRNIAIGAVKDAAKYIKYTGNKKAIASHDKLKEDIKEPKTANQSDLEAFLKREAQSSLDDQADAQLLLGGYFALSDKQKDLFVKVLGRRDFLDISKKNYYSSVFFNTERGFVNEAGRSALTDEYIEKNMGGGNGIHLDEGAHYAAMESLLSTQVDDTAAFSSAKNVGAVISSERCFIMGRKTAVDWKLFKRALNFVHRASEELAMREGNAELYRSAGDLAVNGSITMDYKFLRKNFHNTGGRYFRFAAKNTLVHADKMLGASKTIDLITKKETAVLGKRGLVSKILPGKYGLYIREDLVKAKGMAPKAPKYQVNNFNVRRKPPILKDPKLFYDKAKRDVDNILSNEASIEKAADKLAGLFRGYVTDTTGFGQMFYSDKGKKAKAISSTLDGLKNGVKMSYRKKTGDIRDPLDDMNDVVEILGALLQSRPGQELVKYVKSRLITKAVAKATGENALLADATSKESISKITDEVQKAMVRLVGEKNAIRLLETTQLVKDITKSVADQLSLIAKTAGIATKAVDSFNSICDRAANIGMLSQANEKVQTEHKETDEERLKEAEKHQDERQKQLSKDAAQRNMDYATVAATTTKTLQAIGISQDVINLVVDTTATFSKKFDVSSALIAHSVSMGAEFAMYVARCLKDKNTLRDFYTNTEQGKKEVESIKKGVRAAYPTDTQIDEKMNKMDVLDLVMSGKGYETLEELHAGTGFAIAQSVVFSASGYNPMLGSKLVATTVMAVLGCGELVGNTTMSAVETVYNKMAA